MPYYKYSSEQDVMKAVSKAANRKFIIQRYGCADYRLYDLESQSETPKIEDVLGDSSKLNNADYICSWRGLTWMSRIDYAMEEFLLADLFAAGWEKPLPSGFTSMLVDEVNSLGNQTKTLEDYLMASKKILGF